MPEPSKSKIPNFGKIGDAHLDRIPALADCRPGLQPVEYNVILALAKAPEKVGNLGLIIAPDDTRETAGLAMQVGRIIAMSPLAFGYEAWPPGSRRPRIGDAVWFARYAGGLFEGLDGAEYRIVKDKDIGAIIVEDGNGAA
jgi:co-chaperonin GroES (HSP10)